MLNSARVLLHKSTSMLIILLFV